VAGNKFPARGVLLDIRSFFQEVPMSARRIFTVFAVLLGLLILAGCAAAAGSRNTTSLGLISIGDSNQSVAAMKESGGGEVLPESGVNSSAAGGGLPPLPTSAAPGQADLVTGGQSGQAPMIIKQGQIRLIVKDTDQAIDRLTQIVSDTGGYIISNRIWYEEVADESYKYATYTIGVRVEEFETALRRVRTLALRVVDETASGQDVSEEYTDLESRLRNLEATRDRIRGFLDQAQSVEESLRINQELANIEAQIEQVEGRMRFLSSRAAYSTLTVQFDPEIPVQPTPTPTATPTPTPTPIPYTWDPGKTFERSSNLAIRAAQFLVDMFIYLAVWLPFAVPVLIVWFIYRIVTAKRKPTQP
jgi:hypothetical protein